MAGLKESIERLMAGQLAEWPEFAGRVALMREHGERQLSVGGKQVVVRDNPARLISTTARVTMEAARRDGTPEHCMLCPANRPAEQRRLLWRGLHRHWQVLVNPFPIVEGHFTVVSATHEPQRLGREAVDDMLRLAGALPGYVVTYNGPRCGASIPWHLHLQAMPLGSVPLAAATVAGGQVADGVMCSDTMLPLRCLVVTGEGDDQVAARVTDVVTRLPSDDNSAEPMLNAMAWVPRGERAPVVLIVPRRRHRPSNFGVGPGQLLWSPGVIDLMGLVTLPRREDFDNITPDIIRQVYREIAPDDSAWRELLTELSTNTDLQTR